MDSLYAVLSELEVLGPLRDPLPPKSVEQVSDIEKIEEVIEDLPEEAAPIIPRRTEDLVFDRVSSSIDIVVQGLSELKAALVDVKSAIDSRVPTSETVTYGGGARDRTIASPSDLVLSDRSPRNGKRDDSLEFDPDSQFVGLEPNIPKE